MIQKKCRICRAQLLKVLNFNKVALSGSFLTSAQIKKEKKYPLTLMVCKSCKHIQIQNILNTNILFKHYYAWETGVSKTNMNLIKDLLALMRNKFLFNHKSKFLEIASNDGSLLKEVKTKYKSMVLGIDPAKNLKKLSLKKGITQIDDFFTMKKSENIKKKYGKFDIITANHVCAHVEDLNDFFSGVQNLLKDEGLFVFEISYRASVLKKKDLVLAFLSSLKYFFIYVIF